jgi:hypothetical protein
MMTLNGVVDPKDEFYSGDALTAALDSHCLLADDVVRARSYPEFKQDLYRRTQPTRVSLGSNESRPDSLNMSFPGFGPDALLDTMRFLAYATSAGKTLRLRITTDPDWFNTAARFASRGSAVAYLLSPWTLASTLDLMRRSRTLAFTGWQKEPAGEACVVDRGSPQPGWRADGTFTGAELEPHAWRSFAFERLTAVDRALGIAQRRGWRVIGLSTTAEPPTYADEMRAIFAKHGYRWRIRRIPV